MALLATRPVIAGVEWILVQQRRKACRKAFIWYFHHV